jgi:hypothetical protein
MTTSNYNGSLPSGRLSTAYLEGRGPCCRADRAHLIAHLGEPGQPDGIQASMEIARAGEVPPEAKPQGWRLPEMVAPSGDPTRDFAQALALMDLLLKFGGTLPLCEALEAFERQGGTEDEFARAAGLVGIILYQDNGTPYLGLAVVEMRPGEYLRVLVEYWASRKGGRR